MTIVLALFGCWSPQKDCHSLRLINKFVVPVNNADASLFSFKEYENDETSSARSIVLDPKGEYAFVADAGHGNVKKVDLADGSIKVSRQLADQTGFNLNIFDVGSTAKNVFLTTDRGIVILSKDLDYIGMELSSSRLPSFTEFLYVGNDSVSVVSTQKQRKDLSIDQTILTLVNFKPKTSTRNLPIRDYEATSSGFHRSGKSYAVSNMEDRSEIRTSLGCFKLDRNLSLLGEYFEGRNLDFTSREFVCFDVNPQFLGTPLIRTFNLIETIRKP